ncbi:hypothetical protein JW960_06240 [candidate division KSB1 bacterium]|nr:hypothetical protein [candidate division KSB1 bacterium]
MAITNAYTTITDEYQIYRALEIKPGFYRWNSDELTIIPGKQYELSIKLYDKSFIHGHTWVPGNFKLNVHTKSDTLEYKVKETYAFLYEGIVDPPVISWMPSKHALSYKIDLKGMNSIYRIAFKTTYETSTKLPFFEPDNYNYSDSTFFMQTIRLVLTITAMDSSFLPDESWSLDQSELERFSELSDKLKFDSGQNNNLAQGLGYFASYYSITDTILVRFRKDDNL